MSSHFSVQSIVKKQERLDLPTADSTVVFPDMMKFHPGGDGAVLGQGRAARQAEYTTGFEAGKAEAAQMYEQTIRAMEMALEGLKSSVLQTKKDIEASHGDVVKQCLQALLPELAKSILRQEMQAVILEAAKSKADPHLTVTLHPKNELVKSFLHNSLKDALTLIENEALEADAVHFSWGAATTEINPIKTAETCLDLLGIPSGQDTDLVKRESRQEAS